MGRKVDSSTNTKSPVNVIGLGRRDPKKYTCMCCKGCFIKCGEIPIGITKIDKRWIYDDRVSEIHCRCMLINQIKKRVNNWLLKN